MAIHGSYPTFLRSLFLDAQQKEMASLLIIGAIGATGHYLSSKNPRRPVPKIPLLPPSASVYEMQPTKEVSQTLEHMATQRQREVESGESRTIRPYSGTPDVRRLAQQTNWTDLDRTYQVPNLRGAVTQPGLEAPSFLESKSGGGQWMSTTNKAEKLADQPGRQRLPPGLDPTATAQDRERLATSQMRPDWHVSEPEQVGRGLNRGYTADGSGGFHETYQPSTKTLDDLVVKQRPTLEGRANQGTSASMMSRGLIGVGTQNHAPRFIEAPEMWATRSVVDGPASQGVLPWEGGTQRSARQEQSWGGAQAQNPRGPDASRTDWESTRRGAADRMTLPANGNQRGDAGPTATPDFQVTPTLRPTTAANAYVPVAFRSARSANTESAPLLRQPQARSDALPSGPVQVAARASVRNHTAPAPTLRQNAPTPQSVVSARPKGKTYDPQWAPTTHKETMLAPTRTGGGALTGPVQPPAYDRDALVPDTTLKQMALDSRTANVSRPVPKGVVYDPNDVPRATLKGQDAPEPQRDGTVTHLASSVWRWAEGLYKAVMGRETTDHLEGGQFQNKGGGYLAASWQAPSTHRESTSVEHTGNADAVQTRPSTLRDSAFHWDQAGDKESTLTRPTPTPTGNVAGVGKDQSYGQSVQVKTRTTKSRGKARVRDAADRDANRSARADLASPALERSLGETTRSRHVNEIDQPVFLERPQNDLILRFQ